MSKNQPKLKKKLLPVLYHNFVFKKGRNPNNEITAKTENLHRVNMKIPHMTMKK